MIERIKVEASIALGELVDEVLSHLREQLGLLPSGIEHYLSVSFTIAYHLGIMRGIDDLNKIRYKMDYIDYEDKDKNIE